MRGEEAGTMVKALSVVRWFGGSVVRWFGGSVVRWFGGSVKPGEA
jgi:hypothetical protein